MIEGVVGCLPIGAPMAPSGLIYVLEDKVFRQQFIDELPEEGDVVVLERKHLCAGPADVFPSSESSSQTLIASLPVKVMGGA